MEKYVFYRNSEEIPIIHKDSIAIPLEDKDFMLKLMLDRILSEIKRQGMK